MTVVNADHERIKRAKTILEKLKAAKSQAERDKLYQELGKYITPDMLEKFLQNASLDQLADITEQALKKRK